MTDAPPDYIERMLQAIVGIEVEIERIAGKAKPSSAQPEPAQVESTLPGQCAAGPR
ncbi:MAG: FMN-binding negative transcriptional regulator [Comamonadaceae bacterium]|nr:FMN-binding negative transcriptional regulator [Comamonadaceae bacterium]